MKNLILLGISIFLISTTIRGQKNALTDESFEAIEINGLSIKDLRINLGDLSKLTPFYGEQISLNEITKIGLRGYVFRTN